MVKTILTEAGFIEDKSFKETRFLNPPRETYAVYFDKFDSRGADDANLLKEHEYTIELYSYTPDPDAEKRVEAAFDLYAIPYTKQERYWIQEEQLYQVVFDFDYIEKIRR